MTMNKIKNIQFCILSEKEIEENSVVEVEHYELYEKGFPKACGLYDLRMGTTDKQFRCQTCSGDVISCPGHFGHIKLEEHIYNILYFKTCYKVLQCICLKCSKILNINVKKVSKENNIQLKHCLDNTKKLMTCTYCQFKQPKLSIDNGKICMLEDQEMTVLTGIMTYQIFRKLTDEDCKILGFNPQFSHPKNMLFKNLPVPPPVVRPSVIVDSVMKSQDDLTHKLTEILKCNHTFTKQKKKNKDSNIVNEFRNLLQFHVNSYIDNEIPGQPQATR